MTARHHERTAAATVRVREEIDQIRVAPVHDALVVDDGARQRVADLGARRVTARVQYARSRVAGLEPPCRTTGTRFGGVAFFLVEARTETDEGLDACAGLGRDLRHQPFVAEPLTDVDRVAGVQRGRVVLGLQHGRHAALRPGRVGLVRVALGEHHDALVPVGRFERRAVARDARAHDEHVRQVVGQPVGIERKEVARSGSGHPA